MLEPAVTYCASTDAPYSGKNSFTHIAALNDIRFGRFVARQVLDVDTRYYDDPGFLWSKERFAAGRLGEAYLQYSLPSGFARFGRINRNWGPFIDRSLIVSANPYSYDALEFGLHSSIFEFRYLFAAFPTYTEPFDLDIYNMYRYFSAHVLNVKFGKIGTFGIMESVIFPSTQGFPDLQYVNPLTSYTVIRTNGENGNSNVTMGCQWDLHPALENLSFKGQLLIDDIQVDNTNLAVNKKPNSWATDLGVFWSNCLPLPFAHSLSLEYRYLSRWIYTISDEHLAQGQRYTYIGKSLGFPTNDGDWLNLGFSVMGKKYWALQAGLSFMRQGQGSVDTKWNDLSDSSKALGILPNTLGYTKESPFPSGIVESTGDFYIEAFGYYKNIADVQLRLHNRIVTNKGNVVSPTKYDPQISLAISLHYSDLFYSFPK